MRLTYVMYGLMAVVFGSYYIGDYGYPSYYSEWAHGLVGIASFIQCWIVIYLVSEQGRLDAQLKREFGIVRHPDAIVEYVRIEDLRALEQAEIDAQTHRDA